MHCNGTQTLCVCPVQSLGVVAGGNETICPQFWRRFGNQKRFCVLLFVLLAFKCLMMESFIFEGKGSKAMG